MSRLEYNDDLLLREPIEPYSTLSKLLTTAAVLVLACYAWPLLTYNTTLKRSTYEVWLRLVPTRFGHAMQIILQQLVRASIALGIRGDAPPKGDTLTQIYKNSGLPSVVNRARSLSGYTSMLPPIEGSTFCGLGNWDNSCYQNSILQGLASLPALVEYTRMSQQSCELAQVEGRTHDALSTLMTQLLEELNERNHLWTPGVLKSMDSGQQQDAQEYFSRVTDALEKEATRSQRYWTKKQVPTLASLRSDVRPGVRPTIEAARPSPLEGLNAQALKCQRCGYSEGVTLTPFNCLTLSLGLDGDCNLEDLLDGYTAPELIEGVECDECTRLAAEEVHAGKETTEEGGETGSAAAKESKVLSTKAKQITLGRLPQNLVIHINRSIFDDWGNQKKNSSFVTFPPSLEIEKEWLIPLEIEDAPSIVYELRCIVTHQGRHDNGHYVACAKRGKDWFSFNDEIVTKISQEAVLQRGNVFMLFYERSTMPELHKVVNFPREDVEQLEDDPVLVNEHTLDDDNCTKATTQELPEQIDAQAQSVVTT